MMTRMSPYIDIRMFVLLISDLTIFSENVIVNELSSVYIILRLINR